MNNLLGRSELFLRRNASTILTCLGGVGVVATAVMAVKATPKALELLEQAEEVKEEKLNTIEKIRVAGPIYIPSILVGASSIACVFGANALNKRQQASLISAYALLENSYKEYKNKVAELYGDDANEQVQEGIARDKYEENDIEVEKDKVLFYDSFSGRYFESTIETVQQAEYQINRDIHMRGWAELNEFYEYLDIAAIKGGEVLGWSEGGNYDCYWQAWIDFNHKKVVMDDGLECIILTMFQEPYANYEDYF